MSEEKTPPETSKPATIQIEDIKIILAYLEDMKEQITTRLQGLSNRVALLQRDSVEMAGSVSAMANDFQAARVKRLEEEIAQAEKERGILESRLKIVDEQLSFKKVDSLTAGNTTDKITAAASAAASRTVEDRERLERAEVEERWKKRREAMITAVLTWGSIGLVGSVIAFLWWLFMFYLNNR
jgi:hypothetical protein